MGFSHRYGIPIIWLFTLALTQTEGFILEDFAISSPRLRVEKKGATTERENKLNNRPIIGIFTQPGEYKIGDKSFFEYIAASYVKYLESAGARVVPVRYKSSKQELKSLFSKLNGVLLPGGGTELIPGEPYYEAGVALWEYAKTDPTFPIFGTCLGFELITCLASGDRTPITQSGTFDASNVSWPVKLTASARSSRIFKGLDESVLYALQHENITYNEHSNGVTPNVFKNTAALSSTFSALGTGRDKKNKEFVAIIEAKERPIWGIQFHPEKATFEWYEPVNIPHQPKAIALSQHLANMFVSHARRNHNQFSGTPAEIAKELIQNYRHYFLGNSYFQEVWVF